MRARANNPCKKQAEARECGTSRFPSSVAETLLPVSEPQEERQEGPHHPDRHQPPEPTDASRPRRLPAELPFDEIPVIELFVREVQILRARLLRPACPLVRTAFGTRLGVARHFRAAMGANLRSHEGRVEGRGAGVEGRGAAIRTMTTWAGAIPRFGRSLSLTPPFMGVGDAAKELKPFSTVSAEAPEIRRGVRKPLETVAFSLRRRDTPMNGGVNETARKLIMRIAGRVTSLRSPLDTRHSTLAPPNA